MSDKKAKLYLVGTPIGNLLDITERAKLILTEADVIACEDTRHTSKLLNHLGLKKRLISYHKFNEEARVKQILEILESGKSLALVSDAGMPLISDPGFTLLSRVRENGFDAEIVPGPSAFISAAVMSGLPVEKIYFGGFLPSRTGERQRALREVSEIKATLVFYESPKRLAASLKDCLSVLGDREASVVREITKIHEEVVLGRLSTLCERFSANEVKGEICLVISGEKVADSQYSEENDTEGKILEDARGLINTGLDKREIIKHLCRQFDKKRSEVYRLLQRLKEFE